MTYWLHHSPPGGGPIARDPSRHPPRRVPSWAQAPGGETKGAEIFHWVDKDHVTCCLHHCPPGGGPVAETHLPLGGRTCDMLVASL